MRTCPLPNRHAADLSDFFETVQATLNRNRAKGDLGNMTFEKIIEKIEEEQIELIAELIEFGIRGGDGYSSAQSVEREAADLAVCALSAWLWARRAEHVPGG